VFFASALIHEIAHSFVAKANGIKVGRITLFLFGGISELFEEPPSAESEFKIAIAGPTASIFLAFVFAFFWQLLLKIGTNLLFIAIFKTLFELNFMLAIFNLLPGFPLDGGRVLRSIVWAITKDLKRATQFASRGGKVVAFFLVLLGVFEIFTIGTWGGIWLILIGLFLNQATNQSYLEIRIQEALRDAKVIELLKADIAYLPSNLSVKDALVHYFMNYSEAIFPVMKSDQIIGFVSLNDIKKNTYILPENARISDVMRDFPTDAEIKSDEKVSKALKMMVYKEVSFLPIKDDSHILGIITLDGIAMFLNKKGII
jgi:Zn-dependent protease/predicted transcriptional regulator